MITSHQHIFAGLFYILYENEEARNRKSEHMLLINRINVQGYTEWNESEIMALRCRFGSEAVRLESFG